MQLRAYNPMNRARWALLTLLFVVSQFGPLTTLTGTAKAAGTYELSSSSGIWTAVSGGSNINGVNTNEVRWGYSTGQGQSGLRFDGQGTQSFNENDKINLGKLTHFNFPITDAANGATLKITLVFNSPSVSPNPAFTFQFNIDETANTDKLKDCDSGWQETNTPCDDKITFPNSFPTQSFTIGDKLYTLKIEGFSKTTDGSNPISQFITEENKANQAYLIGSLSSILVARPQLTLVKKTVEGQDANTAPGVSLTVGDTAHFAYYVQNTGNTTLTNISIVDDKGVVATCPQTTLAAGASTVCTGTQAAVAGQYTNTAYAQGKNGQQTIKSNTDPANYYGQPRPGNLTVKKTVTNPNGGQATASSFNIHVKNSSGTDVANSPAVGSATGTTYSLAPGTYKVSEDNPSSLGYKQTSITCNGQATDTVQVTSDSTKICEIKNEDIAPTITLTKEFNGNRYGDTTSANSFGLTIGGVPATSGQSYAVKANQTYKLNEAGGNGYQFYAITGDAKCAKTLNGNTTALNPGENLHCTITNSAVTPTLTIKKIAKNDNGGTVTSDKFNLYTTYNSTKTKLTGGSTVTNSTTTTTTYAAPVTAIGSYTLSEDTVPGYTPASAWSCIGNSAPLNGSTVTVKLGENITCSMTNDDDAPALTLVKDLVDNYSSGAKKTEWTLTATGPSVVSGAGGATNNSIKAGDYTLTESGQTNGFTASSWTCTDAQNHTVSVALNQQLSIALGQKFTCTITNTSVQPKVTVKKHVVDYYNGGKDASDFTLKLSGKDVTLTSGNSNVASSKSFAGSESGTAVYLDQGQYTVTETPAAGYASSFSNDCVGYVSVGQTNKVCTVTNTAIAPKLTLKKEVINNNSGTSKAKDWTLYATPEENEAGANTISGNGYNGVKDVKAKANVTYVLSESGPTGYTAGKWDCDGGKLKGDELTLKLGEDVTCQITNNDNQNPNLTVYKYGPATAHEGDTVLYSFMVVNSGDTYLGHVSLDDDVLGEVDCPQNSLGAGESMTCTAEYVIPAARTADVVNTATACGLYYADKWSDREHEHHSNMFDRGYKENEESGTEVCATDTHTLDVLHPAIKVVKTGPANAKPGEVVTYTFTVTNTGDEPLDGVVVNDNIAGAGTYKSGDTNEDGVLDTTETWVFSAQYTIPADAGGKQIVNTAKACGTELLNNEQEESVDVYSVLKLNREESDAVAQPEDEDAITVCATDSHTTSVEKPQELVNTGTGNFIFVGYILAAAMLGGVFLANRRQTKTN